MTDGGGESSVRAAEAFSALASEHRVAVLRAFADAEVDGDLTLSFTQIYDALELDSTSQLSYHLDHLEGVFVRRTDSGYALNRAGEDVMRAILAGAFTETPSFDPLELSGSCPACSSTTLGATYEDGLLTVRCADCETRVVTYDLPPAALVGRDERAALAACDRRVRHEYAVAVGGTCAKCGGIASVGVDERPGRGGTERYAVAHCQRCSNRVFAPVAAHVLFHPAVVAFYWRQGVDATAIPFWNLSEYLDAWDVDATASESGERSLSVVVRHGGESLSLVLDTALNVTVAEGATTGGGH